MSHPDPLIGLPHDERIRSRKLAGGVATIIADATGLSKSEGETLERELREAALNDAGGQGRAHFNDERSQVARTMLVAIGSGEGGFGKSTVQANLSNRAGGERARRSA